MFACQLLDAEDSSRLDGTGDSYHASGLAWRRGHGRLVSECAYSKEVFGPCAAAAMYRRDRFLTVGGFDADFFCYMEDVDLAFRLRLLGERCRYIPHARVLHIGSAITGYRSDFSSYYGQRNMLWVFFKNMPTGLLLRYLPIFLIVNTMTLYIGWRRKQLRIIARAKLDALRGINMCWRKRRLIQAQRRVSTTELVNSFERGWRSLIKR
jgi:GT2 family glycosyltransferase